MKQLQTLHSGELNGLSVLIAVFLTWTILSGISPLIAQSQSPPPITSSGLNTIVTTNGNVHDITGGTRPGGASGTNLFHSFGDFNVPNNNIANFLNGVSFDTNGAALSAGLPTANILARVTGTNGNNPTLSSIYGTIQTTGFGNANLFLMNPAGFLFGPNATINVGGMVAFTSADYLRLQGAGGDGIFYADPAANSVLTTSPVAAFGFLGSNPGAITVQGSQFTVAEGTGISLVGGNITVQSGVLDDGVTIQPARLSAPGGQINLASVASPGEILYPSLANAPNVNGQSFTTMGNITLSDGSTLDVSANAAGTVHIRGGHLVITEGTISADTVDANGASTAVEIQLTGDMSISNDLGPAITARTFGAGDAGKVNIVSSNLSASSNSFDIFSFIDTHTLASGRAGDVNIVTGDLTINGSPDGFISFIDSGTESSGHGGDVTISTQNFQMDLSLINTGNFFANAFGVDATGSAGNLNISSTGSFNLIGGVLVTDAFSIENGTGEAGNINLSAQNMNLSFLSNVTSGGHLRGGSITVTVDQLHAEDSTFITATNLSSGGGITLTGRSIELSTGSSLVSSTSGDGNAGPIVVTATDQLSLTRANNADRPSGIFSNSRGFFGSNGNAGDITINTPLLQMTGGARINTSTSTSGRGGNVTINANSISMSGESGSFSPEPLFNLGVTQSSGIFTLSVGGNCAGPCGNAGNISINTGSLSMGTGSQINSGTSSSGHGGNISINASDTITMSGTLSTGQAGGIQSRSTGADADAGAGGNISLTAGQSVAISDGAAVSASSTGPGPTGNITINAGNQFAMTNASVTTEADQSSGGKIKITTNPDGTVQLTDSMISASVLDGAGGGGSVNIDPQSVILVNSQILANAVSGPGGNIFITTNLLLPDANSTISASSQFGQQGTITIQSPNAPAGGKIVPLSQKPLIATSLLTQRCVALAEGNFSSFTMAGRDSLPAEPSSWMASPLALPTIAEGQGQLVLTTDRWEVASAEEEQSLLSLRQIAPHGFLTHTFAGDVSAGCTS